MSSAKFLEEFRPVATEKWQEVITRDLKGADYAKRLIWQTDEQIPVKPFYRSEDLAGLEYLESTPGEFPYTRGARDSNAWRIRERIESPDIADARQRAAEALAGADEVEFAVGPRGLTLCEPQDVLSLIEGLHCPVHFEAGEEAAALLRLLVTALGDRPEFEGSLDYAPFTESGDSAAAAKLIGSAIRALPRFRPVTIRAHRFHDSGATITQELGYALAEGIENLAMLTGSGLSVDEAASSLTFSFAAGWNFFFEIAKMRAARLLWARAVEAFHPASAESAKAQIHIRTSRWDKTIYDPYVNVLRATTETMSAAMGGCDSIGVDPFDETYCYPGELSRRLARNTSLVLKHEALLDRAVDPAGGSYYVEALTDSIARESWKLMQENEAGGGFRKASKSGSIRAAIDKSRAAKEAAVKSRKRSILGTNQYPNQKERMLTQIVRKPEDMIRPRAAEVFESIRLRTERHAAKSGHTPLFLLLEMGDLKMRKARSGFVANFFGCAGFTTKTAVPESEDAAVKMIADRKPDAVVLCSSDAEYLVLAGSLCQKLHGAGNKVPVIVAGYPKEAIPALTAAGVADFVHVRSNAAEVLESWQARLGVKE
jgi:methylmalonyl-CoA mutase